MIQEQKKIIIDEDTGSVVMIDTPDAIAKMKVAMGQIEKPLKTLYGFLRVLASRCLSAPKSILPLK